MLDHGSPERPRIRDDDPDLHRAENSSRRAGHCTRGQNRIESGASGRLWQVEPESGVEEDCGNSKSVAIEAPTTVAVAALVGEAAARRRATGRRRSRAPEPRERART